MIHNQALLVIDVQYESQFGIIGVDEVVRKTKEVIETARKHNIPIIYTRHINRQDTAGLSLGEPADKNGEPIFYNSGTNSIEIFEEIKPQAQDIVIDKYRWSAFHGTSLHLMLRGLGVQELFIGGFVTDGCVMTTVFDAYFHDYKLNLIHDICGSTNEGAQMSSILTMCNWVYDVKVYDANKFIRSLNGEAVSPWKAEEPDSAKFTPETMRDVFKRVTL